MLTNCCRSLRCPIVRGFGSSDDSRQESYAHGSWYSIHQALTRNLTIYLNIFWFLIKPNCLQSLFRNLSKFFCEWCFIFAYVQRFIAVISFFLIAKNRKIVIQALFKRESTIWKSYSLFNRRNFRNINQEIFNKESIKKKLIQISYSYRLYYLLH